MKRTEIREPRGSTPVITDVVEISEVKRSDKNTARETALTFVNRKYTFSCFFFAEKKKNVLDTSVHSVLKIKHKEKKVH